MTPPLATDYLLVLSTGRLHHLPTREECNVDVVPRNKRRRFRDRTLAQSHPAYRDDCKHCSTVVIANPEPDTQPEEALD